MFIESFYGSKKPRESPPAHLIRGVQKISFSIRGVSKRNFLIFCFKTATKRTYLRAIIKGCTCKKKACSSNNNCSCRTRNGCTRKTCKCLCYIVTEEIQQVIQVDVVEDEGLDVEEEGEDTDFISIEDDNSGNDGDVEFEANCSDDSDDDADN